MSAYQTHYNKTTVHLVKQYPNQMLR